MRSAARRSPPSSSPTPIATTRRAPRALAGAHRRADRRLRAAPALAPPRRGEATRLDASARPRPPAGPGTGRGETPSPGAAARCGALATPGHTANHLAFALEEESALFSGDHVMAWSTSIVAPPDGAMSDYMASLHEARGARATRVFWPGHGGPVADPQRWVRGLLTHRRQREAAILERLAAGDGTSPTSCRSSTPASRRPCGARLRSPSTRIWRISSAAAWPASRRHAPRSIARYRSGVERLTSPRSAVS